MNERLAPWVTGNALKELWRTYRLGLLSFNGRGVNETKLLGLRSLLVCFQFSKFRGRAAHVSLRAGSIQCDIFNGFGMRCDRIS